jgi:hypothetical protein
MMCQLPIYGELAPTEVLARELGEVLLRGVGLLAVVRGNVRKMAELVISNSAPRQVGLP